MGPFTRAEVAVGVITVVMAALATYFVKAVDAAPNIAAVVILTVLVGCGIAGGMVTERDGKR